MIRPLLAAMALFAVVAGAAEAQGLQGAYGVAGAYEALERLRAERQGRSVVDLDFGWTRAILIFGGENNDQFLGCLNCGEVNMNSVFNPVGRFGSPVSITSIKNKVGRFGSQVSMYSPCNPVAAQPPVLVDEDGTFYGELTVNAVRPRRVKNGVLNAWLRGMCEA